MSQFHQIQLTFDPLEDRLLFRINTTTQTEYLLWFTRRYVKLLWSLLMELMQRSLQANEGKMPEQKKELLSFEHEKALNNADFQTQYQEGQFEHPLGDTPVLVSKVTLKNQSKNIRSLCLHPETGEGIELTLDNKLMHLLCKLLSDAVQKAEWDMNLEIPTQTIPVTATDIN